MELLVKTAWVRDALSLTVHCVLRWETFFLCCMGPLNLHFSRIFPLVKIVSGSPQSGSIVPSAIPWGKVLSQCSDPISLGPIHTLNLGILNKTVLGQEISLNLIYFQLPQLTIMDLGAENQSQTLRENTFSLLPVSTLLQSAVLPHF